MEQNAVHKEEEAYNKNNKTTMMFKKIKSLLLCSKLRVRVRQRSGRSGRTGKRGKRRRR